MLTGIGLVIGGTVQEEVVAGEPGLCEERRLAFELVRVSEGAIEDGWIEGVRDVILSRGCKVWVHTSSQAAKAGVLFTLGSKKKRPSPALWPVMTLTLWSNAPSRSSWPEPGGHDGTVDDGTECVCGIGAVEDLFCIGGDDGFGRQLAGLVKVGDVEQVKERFEAVFPLDGARVHEEARRLRNCLREWRRTLQTSKGCDLHHCA
jgi:hypothetical protein